MQEVFEKIIEKLKEETYDMEICEEQTGKSGPYFVDVPYKMIKLDDAINIVKQAAGEYNNGWIPVSKGLPEEYQLKGE